MRPLQRRGCSDSPRFAAELASDLISDAEIRRCEDYLQDRSARPASADALRQDLNAHLILLVTYAEGLDTNEVAQAQELDASYAARSASMFEQTHSYVRATDGFEQTGTCAEPAKGVEGGAL